MKSEELAGLLQAALGARGMAHGSANPRRGRVALSLVWLRPEPVRLLADPVTGRLLLDGFLPFVMPGGKLHRDVKAWVQAGVDPRSDTALCISRAGNLTIGLVPVAADWSAALDRLLALGEQLCRKLRAEWPDYAAGVFAPPLR